MSHSEIQKYTKDFNFLWKADFEIGELNSKGYELELHKCIDKYLKENKNFFNIFFQSYNYLPLHSSICFVKLLLTIVDTKYESLLCEALRINENAIKYLFLSTLEISDLILQLYDSLENIVCNLLKVKPIIIDMQKSSQVMTSKTDKFLNLDSCLFESQSDVNPFKILGFDCVRLKIESEPTYIDSLDSDSRSKDFIYYEIHIKCDSKLLNDFDLNVLSNNWYKSKNRFKDNIHFITFRSKDESLIESVTKDINY